MDRDANRGRLFIIVLTIAIALVVSWLFYIKSYAYRQHLWREYDNAAEEAEKDAIHRRILELADEER